MLGLFASFCNLLVYIGLKINIRLSKLLLLLDSMLQAIFTAFRRGAVDLKFFFLDISSVIKFEIFLQIIPIFEWNS